MITISKSINVEIPDDLSDVSDVLDEIIKNLLKKKDSKSIEKFRKIVKEVNNKIKSKEVPDTLELLQELRKMIVLDSSIIVDALIIPCRKKRDEISS